MQYLILRATRRPYRNRPRTYQIEECIRCAASRKRLNLSQLYSDPLRLDTMSRYSNFDGLLGAKRRFRRTSRRMSCATWISGWRNLRL